MSLDPYGYPTDQTAPATGSPGSALVAALFVSTMSLLFALGCGGFGVAVGASSDDPALLDKVGVGLLTSTCAWPAAATAIWSGVLLGAYRGAAWMQLGPNLALGCVTGLFAWFVVCSGVLVLSVGDDRAAEQAADDATAD